MYCSSCGTQAREGDRFCLKCGAELTASAQQRSPRGKPHKRRHTSVKSTGGFVARHGRALPIALLLLVGALIGYAVYSVAAERAYSAAAEDYREGACRDALSRFEQVYGVYKLAVTSPTAEAKARAAECRQLNEADKVIQVPEISAYPRDYASALVTYQRLDQRLPSEAEAIRASVARGLDAVWSFKRGRNACDEEPYLVSISAASGLGQQLRNRAERQLPNVTLTCARAHRRRHQYQSAIETYRALIRDYPDSRAAASGTTELIAVRVDGYAARAGKGELPPPPVSGQGASGSVEVTIENGSPAPLEVLFSGANAGDSIRVPACKSCEEVSSGAADSFSCSDAPSRTVKIKPGRYRTVARSPGDGSIRPYVGDWDLTSGYTYDDCYYIKRSR